MDKTIEVAAKTSEIPGFWTMILKSAGMLLIVLGVLFAIAFIIKKIMGVRSGLIKDEIKLISLFHLAPKEKVALIEVENKKILIGVTPQNINSLAIFDSNIVSEENENTENFAEMLKKKIIPASFPDKNSGETKCSKRDSEQGE